MKIFVAGMVGFTLAAAIVDYIGGTHLKALARYNNCIADGGTKDHCLDKYLLLRKREP